jgi:uncharacterized protein YwqG
MKQDLIDLIKSSDFEDKTKLDIINSLTDRYLIEVQKMNIHLGDSKIGGYPHLPKNFEYPQEETYFYEFVGQINLSDLKDNGILNFPQRGIIYFFIDDDFKVSNVNTKVFLLDNDFSQLEVKHPPKNKKSRCETFLDRTEFTELKLQFKKDYTIDQKLLDKIIDDQVISGGTKKTVFDIEQFYTRDQVWGYTTTWGSGDAQWSAYLANRRLSSLYWLTLDYQIERLNNEKIDIKNWLHIKIDEAINKQKDMLLKYDKSAYIYSYWEKELIDLEFTKLNLDDFVDNLDIHKRESKKWQMVLSLSSYNEAKMTFGDGRMEFFINLDDLEKQNFNNFYCHIYNG